jgi:3-oxoacyl-[acyl-carrier-protein] synthase-3
MSVTIERIEYFLPDTVVTNDDLQRENPSWDMESVVKKSGVQRRYIAEEGVTSLDLAVKACSKLFETFDLKAIDGIIFCTQTPDLIMPSNAFLLHKHFQFPQNVLAFDFNLACSGFVYGLAISQGLIVSGVASKILLVNADTYSKLINRKDRSSRVLFGDGASVSLVSKSTSSKGILDIALATSGKDFESFYVPAGGCRVPMSRSTSEEKIDASGNVRSMNNLAMNGFAVWRFIQSAVPRQIEGVLRRNKLAVDDIDLFVFHQASKLTLDSLIKILKIDERKVFLNIENIGNTVSASIPIALRDASEKGVLSRGDVILISGFGVGLSWGTILMEY